MSEAFRRPPTGQEGHLPPREVSLPPGGQNPITLEYQIYPPTIDTIVTGMVPVARQPKGPGSVGFVEREAEKSVRRQMQSGKNVDVGLKVGPCSVISQKLLDAWVEGCKRMLENREYLGNLVKKEKRAVDWSNVDSEVLIARLEDGEEGQEEILNWILSGDNFQIICDSTSTQVSWVVSSLFDFVSSGSVIGNEGCQQHSAGGSL